MHLYLEIDMKRLIIKRLAMISLLFLIVGCGGSSRYFMLTEPEMMSHHYTKQLPLVGVEKISLPEYMQQGSVAKQLSSTQIEYSKDAKWSEDMEESLTKQLIIAIQKSFNHPDVYAYPWDLSKQANIKIKVTVSRFIAYGKNIYLDASWKISDLRRSKERSQLFSIAVPTGSTDEEIVTGMNRAFSKLSKKIVTDLNRNF